MRDSKHDRIAKRIAGNENAEYNEGQGPDVITSRRVIEVATHLEDLKDSTRQLQGFRKLRYLAVPGDLMSEARDITKDTKIGLMNARGEIVKRAGGGKRK